MASKNNFSGYLPHLTTEGVAAAAREGAVLLLPLGTVESNGPHQLLGCDYLLTERLAQAVADRGAVLRLPTFHYGISEMHDGMPGTFGVPEALFSQVLRTVLENAARNGFRHAVLLNCHRHNHQPIEILARALRRENTIGVAVIDPLEVTRDLSRDLFAGDAPGAFGHGGEPLASLSLHLNPDEMRLDRAQPGALQPFHGLKALASTRFAFNGSRVGLFPNAEEINPSGAWADLTNTHADRGRVAFERLCDFTTEFVETFRQLPLVPQATPSH